MNSNFANDKRWNLGGYILKQNPHSVSKTYRNIAQPKMNARGRMYSSKEGFEKKMDFSFDLYEKKTQITKSVENISANQYISMAIDSPLKNLYMLSTDGSIDIYSYDGEFIDSKNIDKSNYATTSNVTDELNINPMALIDGDVNTYWKSDASHVTHTAMISMDANKTISYLDVYVKDGCNATIDVYFWESSGKTKKTLSVTPDMFGRYSIALNGTVECKIIELVITHNDSNREVISQVYYGYEPVGNPISMTHIGMGEIAVLYSYLIETNSQEIVIYDENIVENRKYIYKTVPEMLKIAWNIDQNMIALTVDRTFFELSKNNGSFNFKGNPPSSNHYTQAIDLLCIKKVDDTFIGVVFDDKIEFLNLLTLERVELAKLPKKMDCIVYEDVDRDFYAMTGGTLNKVTVNTTKLDVIALKRLCLMGKIILYDEFGYPFSLIVDSLGVERLRNMAESRYIIAISAQLTYENQGFKHGYYGDYVHPGDNMSKPMQM